MATWTNGASGRVRAGVDRPRLLDLQELADAINRRRLITMQGPQDFSSVIMSGSKIRNTPIAAGYYPPFDCFRTQLVDRIISPPIHQYGGDPPTPALIEWLWPIADGDENKVIVSGLGSVPSGKVGLLPKINSTSNWTNPSLTPGSTSSRIQHINELRQGIEYLTRCRIDVYIYFCWGLFSILPNQSWAPFMANNGEDEVRPIGYALLNNDGFSPTQGIVNCAGRLSSYVDVLAEGSEGETATAELYHFDIDAADFQETPPTWNNFPWDNENLRTLLGTVTISPNVPCRVTANGSAMTSMITNIAYGQHQIFALKQTSVSDYGWDLGTPPGGATLIRCEFDLDIPPN